MDSHVVSFEWAKKLNECGWNGPSYFLWAYHCWSFPDDSIYQRPHLISRDTEDHNHQWEVYPAPTWSDIWFSLPVEFRLYQQDTFEVTLDSAFIDSWNPVIHGIEQYAPFQSRRTDPPLFVPKEKTMHDDMAAMWCYLSENKLLPPL